MTIKEEKTSFKEWLKELKDPKWCERLKNLWLSQGLQDDIL
jgi:hypothetical protein